MANDFAQIQQTAFETFHAPMYEGTVGWEKFLHIRNENVKTIQLGNILAGGIYAAAGTGDLAADDIDTVNSSIVSTPFEQKGRVRWQDLDDNPNAVTEVALSIGSAAMSSLLKLVSDYMAGLFTMAHPNVGLVGAGKKFIDTNLRINNDAGNLQSNKLSLALSSDSFHAAKTLLTQYKNHRDLTLDLGNNGVALVYGPTNERTALQLIQSTLSGADNQKNIIADMGVTGVKLPAFGEDWLMIDQRVKPVVLHMRRAPSVQISRTTDGIWVEVVGTFTATMGVKPTEAGIIGSDAP